MLLLPVQRRATRCALAKNGQVPAARSRLLPAVLPPAAKNALQRHSADRSPVSQTIETLPSSRPGSPAARTPACPGKSQTPRACPGESPPRQRKTPPPALSIRFRRGRTSRSEEHTSELQSHSDLVCRLLLEKKK